MAHLTGRFFNVGCAIVLVQLRGAVFSLAGVTWTSTSSGLAHSLLKS